MEPALQQTLVERLIRDYQFKRRGDWLQGGKCPSCGEKELYISATSPWLMRCNRQNNCGYEEHIKDRYPDLFESWSDRFPSQPDYPNAAADAYLRDLRGFDLQKIKGWYTQENFWNPELGQGSATVRFTVPVKGAQVSWERIIDRPWRFGKQKANFKGNYGGYWWVPPDTDLTTAKEIWIVEGCFDAIALHHHGITAVSVLSSNNYPAARLAELANQVEQNGGTRPLLIWALDADGAGRKAILKMAEKAHQDGWDVAAALPSQGKRKGRDWNDCHLFKALGESHLKKYRFYGDLLLAKSPSEAGRLIHEYKGRASFPFDHQNRLYWFDYNHERFLKLSEIYHTQGTPQGEAQRQAMEQSTTISEIANCLPTALYYLANTVTDESWYYFQVDRPDSNLVIKNTFTAAQLTSVPEFKKRLLSIGAGAIWSGAGYQLDVMLKAWTRKIKTVQTIDYIGYSAEHGCYVFDKVAAKDGKIVELNDEDYFDVGKLSIKSLNRSLKLDINIKREEGGPDWFSRLSTCYGALGHLALAYWLGCLFAEQIRTRFESFPFIEIVGEAGSGKSTLIETLWKLLGRNNYEGFDPLKGSTVGFLRSMAQVSNLPVVLIESDRDNTDGSQGRSKSSFHWDSMKSLYNGGSLRTTGVKNSGNDTYEPQFRGALVISQNQPVSASRPIMERIIHLWFDKSRQSDAGREAGLELGRMSAGDISGFMAKAISQEGKIMGLIEQRMRFYEQKIQQAGVGNLRIQKNYAQLMVLVDALLLVCPISPTQQAEAKRLIEPLAIERERKIAVDHPLVSEFWEAFDYLDGLSARTRLNHSSDPGMIAVNLNHFVQVAVEQRQSIPPLSDLKRVLKESKSREFIEQRQVRSAINKIHNHYNASDPRPETLKCWLFTNPKTAP